MNDENTIINGSGGENSRKLCFENAAQDCGPSFGVPPLGGALYEPPPEGGTPNLNCILGRLLTAEQQEQEMSQQNEEKRLRNRGFYRSIQVNTGQYRSIQVEKK